MSLDGPLPGVKDSPTGFVHQGAEDERDARETALALLDAGFWPVPLRPPGQALPRGGAAKGKEPIYTGWGKARDGRDAIAGAYQVHPGAGVGIAFGPGPGIIDIEVDGEGGEESLGSLFGGSVPETLGWESRRGRHRIFRWDDRLSRIGLAQVNDLPDVPGVEFKLGCDGRQSQSACPPTLGEDGKPRRWVGGTIIAELPGGVVSRLLAAWERKGARPGPPSAELRTERPTHRFDRDADPHALFERCLKEFPVPGHGSRDRILNSLLMSLAGQGYRLDLISRAAKQWWVHYYQAGKIQTHPSEAAARVRRELDRIIRSPKFEQRREEDRVGLIAEVPVPAWIEARLECKISRITSDITHGWCPLSHLSGRILIGINSEILAVTTHPGTPAHDDARGCRRLCETEPERVFVRNLCRIAGDPYRDAGSETIRFTDAQLRDLAARAGGVTCLPKTLEDLKRRYLTRGEKTAERYELAVMTEKGKQGRGGMPGTPSVYKLTGLLRLLEPPPSPETRS